MASTIDEVARPKPRFVALVTGATGAIGRAIAERIAARHEHEVVLVCRDAEKAATTADAIRRRTGNPGIRFEVVDLSRRALLQLKQLRIVDIVLAGKYPRAEVIVLYG